MSAPPARLSLIAAMDRARLIGVRGERMPWHLPEDLKHFRRTTLGKPVVMGRRTHASIGRPLPGRFNIVLSRSGAVPEVPGQLCCATDLPQALQRARAWLLEHPPADADPELFVIGGADVYAQAIDLADRLYLTEIDARFDGDNHFPAFDVMHPGLAEVTRETHRADPPNSFDYAFVTYDRTGARR
jgi:dihydrofolate reductase